MKKVMYSVEIEACEQLVFDDVISKKTFDRYTQRLFQQVNETRNDETQTEFLGTEMYETPFRIVETSTFLRTTTFITLNKTTFKK